MRSSIFLKSSFPIRVMLIFLNDYFARVPVNVRVLVLILIDREVNKVAIIFALKKIHDLVVNRLEIGVFFEM